MMMNKFNLDAVGELAKAMPIKGRLYMVRASGRRPFLGVVADIVGNPYPTIIVTPYGEEGSLALLLHNTKFDKP